MYFFSTHVSVTLGTDMQQKIAFGDNWTYVNDP